MTTIKIPEGMIYTVYPSAQCIPFKGVKYKAGDNTFFYLPSKSRDKSLKVGPYQKQAEDFLTKHGITFESVFLRQTQNPWGVAKKEKEYFPNDVYQVSFTQGTKKFELEFTQSNACSLGGKLYWDGQIIRAKTGYHPQPYDVLACLTKSNPGSFEDFCSEYGYDADSRKAEKVYHNVVQEYLKVIAFFTEGQTEGQTEELMEIQ